MSYARHWCLTIWGHDGNPPSVPVYDDGTMVFLCGQYEVCPGTSREHIQAYVCFSRKRRLNFVRTVFGNAGHYEVARGSPIENRAYCSKVESRKPQTVPFEYGDIPAGRGERTDLKEFVEKISENPFIDEYADFPEIAAKYPRFVDGARKRALARRNPPTEVEFHSDREWQTDLSEALSEPAHPRQIRWFYDFVGNTGKSYFANYWTPDGGGRNDVYVITGGKHSDIFYSYSYERYVFFDYARAQEESFPYAVVESFKNGYFLSTKYESRVVRFGIPHVVVFCNFSPDISKLSSDRFIIKKLD